MNKITVALSLGVFGIITTEFGIIGTLPDIAAYYNISIDQTGSLISIFALIVAMAGPFMTLLMIDFDKKKVVQFVLGIFLFSNLLSVFSESFGSLLFARVLPAFVLPLYFSFGLTIATNSVGKGKAMKAVATVYGGLSVATIVGIPMSTYLSALNSWKASFYMMAIFNLVALLIISVIVPSYADDREQRKKMPLNILKKSMLWVNILIVCLFSAGAFSVYSYFSEYLKGAFGMTGIQISSMLLLFGTTGVLGNWIAGVTLNKSITKTMTTYLCVMPFVFVALQFAGGNLLFQIVLVAVWGFFHMAGFVIGQAWISSAAPEAPEFANSLVVSTGNLGVALGAAIGGFVISNFGLIYILWAGIVLISLSGLVVLMSRLKSLSNEDGVKEKTKVLS